jgi:transmembrane sensor
MTRHETSSEIDEEAASWAARLDRSLDPAEQTALSRWLDDDTRRIGALARAQAVLARLDDGVVLDDDFCAETPAEEMPRRRILQIAVAGAAIAASGAWVFAAKGAETFTTRKGEIRLVPLHDGSVITLNTASSVAVRFDRKRRFVQLIDGEALFEVAKDRTRPFIVEVGSTRVQAVGTAFTVRNVQRGPVLVSVQEGIVEMTSSRKAFKPQRLLANMRAQTGDNMEVVRTEVDPAQGAAELAWRQGKIAFRGETLREAAVELGRYSDTRIAFENDAVAGFFSTYDIPRFAEAAALSLNLNATIRDDEVYFSTNKDTPTYAGAQ